MEIVGVLHQYTQAISRGVVVGVVGGREMKSKCGIGRLEGCRGMNDSI